jgi:DNA helicase-2/ATP-dependent DNA helicase PcrA
VDEMQDTNPLQYELLSSFYEKCSLFCVGDDAQSIYGFRGADFKTMHNFVNIVPNSEVKKLTLNYRSTQEILDLSNWLLNQSPLQYGKDLKAYRGKSNFLPQVINVDNDWSEANDIIDKILSSITEKGLKFNDNMVISRTLYGLRKVEACCLEKKIPYVVFGGSGLMQSQHVRDLVSALRIVSNIQDELAWMRYLMLWQGIGEVTAAQIIEKVIFSQSIKEALDILSGLNLQTEISTTLNNIMDLQSNPSESIHEAYKIMEKRLSEIYKDEWEWRKQDFEILQEVALSTGSITEFVAEYVLDPKLETTMKNMGKLKDIVTLTTIHSAKGLEAKICYVVNVSPYGYPTQRAILNGSDSIEEERRCLYVALTRAKDELYIYRNIYSNHVVQPQSKYIGAIVIGSIFVEKDNHENQILITYIQEKEGYNYIGFRPFNYDGPYGDLVELSFRKLYIPLSEINNKENIQQDDYYFLNNVPENLIQNSYKGMSSKDFDTFTYSGDQIKDDDIDEFDFS